MRRLVARESCPRRADRKKPQPVKAGARSRKTPYADFSLFVREQQSFPQSLADLSQQFAVVLFLPQQSSPQVFAVLPSFMQDFASLPAQQDLASLQQEAISLASPAWWCAQQAGASFELEAAIWSQHEHFAFSVGAVPCGGADGVVGVAVCAHDARVRARTNASILCFIMISCEYEFVDGLTSAAQAEATINPLLDKRDYASGVGENSVAQNCGSDRGKLKWTGIEILGSSTNAETLYKVGRYFDGKVFRSQSR